MARSTILYEVVSRLAVFDHLIMVSQVSLTVSGRGISSE
jgi:hypothetical protein